MPKIDLELKHAFRAVRTRVEAYGVRVYIGDVADPNTGTFNGSEIGIDYANELEMSLFVLVHLFGHTVQWNVVPAYRTIDERVKPFAAPEIIEEARLYEHNASRYGLTLLHEAGIRDRDQWLSDWWGSDWRYLSTYYSTGVLPTWNDFRGAGFPLLEPLPIPKFDTGSYPPRYAF
ncbi:MAG: hypothetical protein KBF88_06420 [Polyangiaceae bacterium]|nr:hypothetical protein [Polyangiaceae bacterium]